MTLKPILALVLEILACRAAAQRPVVTTIDSTWRTYRLPNARFTVTLPARVADRREATLIPVGPSTNPPAAKRVSAPRSRHGTILVIDDDANARELLERTLTREGFKVVTADRGEEVMQLAREVRPDLITLDVLMPGLDGWGVLASLKSDPRRPRCMRNDMTSVSRSGSIGGFVT